MTALALSIGSNINAPENIRAAVKALAVEFENIVCSTVFESEAVGFEGDNFLNLVVLINTENKLDQIVLSLKQLEDKLGRNRSQAKFSGRPIDIDILIYGDEAGSEQGIQLPRPEITENAYVLQPLAELLPDQIHAPSGKSYLQLWETYDKSSQRLWPIQFNW